MKNDNANQWFSVRVAAVILGVAALVTGSTATTMVFAVSQTLSTCTDVEHSNHIVTYSVNPTLKLIYLLLHTF